LLNDLGLFPKSEIDGIASKLVTSGVYHRAGVYASLFFVGSRFDDSLPNDAPRKCWSEVLAFIYDRFNAYKNIKADHQQWDYVGKQLWSYFDTTGTKDNFVQAVQKILTP